MKAIRSSFIVLLMTTVIVSCKKEECSECHYDLNSTETVELGEKCGDDLFVLESDGIAVGDTIYEVHCHGH